jgi:hypothetical protein
MMLDSTRSCDSEPGAAVTCSLKTRGLKRPFPPSDGQSPTGTSALEAASLLHHHNYHSCSDLLSTSVSSDPPLPVEELENDDEYFDWEREALMQRAIARIERTGLPHHVNRGFRATAWDCGSVRRPHMRAFHAAWLLFFTSLVVQFSVAPLLPEMQHSFPLSNADIWYTNVVMSMGGIPARFVLGSCCDQYGAKTVMTLLVALSAIPAALVGVVAVNKHSLAAMRFLLGATDAFVPSQYWITVRTLRSHNETIL